MSTQIDSRPMPHCKRIIKTKGRSSPKVMHKASEYMSIMSSIQSDMTHKLTVTTRDGLMGRDVDSVLDWPSAGL